MATSELTLRQVVASEVRAEMARQRMSQSALARLLREGQPWVNRRVNADVAMDLDDVERIARALDVPLSTFLSAGMEGLSRRRP
jgi:transcriptional regulator with XRE-family HTH domain